MTLPRPVGQSHSVLRVVSKGSLGGLRPIDGLPTHPQRAPRRSLSPSSSVQITEWFEKFGDKLPTVLWTELDGLRERLGAR